MRGGPWGPVLIPAFAVDRTEVILFRLRERLMAQAIPDRPIFVDSPMALAALTVYRDAVARNAAGIDPGLSAQRDGFNGGRVTESAMSETPRALPAFGVPASSCPPRAWPPADG